MLQRLEYCVYEDAVSVCLHLMEKQIVVTVGLYKVIILPYLESLMLAVFASRRDFLMQRERDY